MKTSYFDLVTIPGNSDSTKGMLCGPKAYIVPKLSSKVRIPCENGTEYEVITISSQFVSSCEVSSDAERMQYDLKQIQKQAKEFFVQERARAQEKLRVI